MTIVNPFPGLVITKDPGNELFLIWRELGMGFSRPEWRSHEGGKKNFHMNGLAGIVKEYFSMSGKAVNGEILFHYDY